MPHVPSGISSFGNPSLAAPGRTQGWHAFSILDCQEVVVILFLSNDIRVAPASELLTVQPVFGLNPLVTVKLLSFVDGSVCDVGTALTSVSPCVLSGCSLACVHSRFSPRVDCPSGCNYWLCIPWLSVKTPKCAAMLLFATVEELRAPSETLHRGLSYLPVSLRVDLPTFFSKLRQSPLAEEQNTSSAEPGFLLWHNFCGPVQELRGNDSGPLLLCDTLF